MRQQDKQADVEGLQGSDSRRGRCLDVCLMVSVLVLFAAVTAMAVGGVMVVNALQKELRYKCCPPPESTQSFTEDAPSPAYKIQDFAYLEATSGQLITNSTMHLGIIRDGEVTSVGSNFLFNPEQHALTPKQEGTFFIYINLNLTCTHTCSAGPLKVKVADKLTCEVQLPSVKGSGPLHSRSLTKKCWTVTPMGVQKLLTQITVPSAGLRNWKLELKGTGIGIFFVDK